MQHGILSRQSRRTHGTGVSEEALPFIMVLAITKIGYTSIEVTILPASTDTKEFKKRHCHLRQQQNHKTRILLLQRGKTIV